MQVPRRWLWQSLIWSVYAALSLIMAAQYVALTSGIVMIMLTVALGLWAASEALRAGLLRRHWLDLGGWSLLWRIGVVVPVAAAIVQGLVFVLVRVTVTLAWITLPPGGADYRLGSAGGYVINTSIMLWLWCAGWVSWQYLRRYRQGEVVKWRAEAAQHKLELDVLKGQINPHFMFNALNNLRAMINEDKDKARDMVTQLSHILRHALYHSQQDRVSVEDELAVVRDYLALELLHYEDCLRVNWSLDDSALQATLPPMVLQLLVENAVKHGIAQTVGGGVLDIGVAWSSTAGTRALALRVANPGQWKPQSPGAGGLGLPNLRQRLNRVCGPGAQCQVEEREGRVDIRVHIPQ